VISDDQIDQNLKPQKHWHVNETILHLALFFETWFQCLTPSLWGRPMFLWIQRSSTPDSTQERGQPTWFLAKLPSRNSMLRLWCHLTIFTSTSRKNGFFMIFHDVSVQKIQTWSILWKDVLWDQQDYINTIYIYTWLYGYVILYNYTNTLSMTTT
jgi:hypothetical protein